MPTWMNVTTLKQITLCWLVSTPAMSAGLDSLSKSKPEGVNASPAASQTKSPTKPATSTSSATPTLVTPPAKPTPATPAAPAVIVTPRSQESTQQEQPKSGQLPNHSIAERSQFSKRLAKRLSLATSLGWAVVKPSTGSWSGIGASDITARWRESRKADLMFMITARYAPMTGVWRVDQRDYDTTLHGMYFGVELQKPIESMGAPTIKTGLELGYVMVHAAPQDKAEADSKVKGGKINLAVSGGADWDILGGKIKVGPFVRAHLAGFSVARIVSRRNSLQTQNAFVSGFSIFNVGGSINFVF